jgi:AraC-like DNA-binding protein
MLGLVRLVQRPGERDEARSTISNGRPVVVFPPGMLERPLKPLFPARAIDEAAEQAWLASTPAGDFAGAVQQVIDMLSSPTAPRIGLTAAAIGISVRGLQRRLAEAGMSYERLVVQSRFATATQLLQNTDATVLDVALDAGYSDHAHFTRAFRRWTGMSPSEFRRTRRGAVRAVNDDRRVSTGRRLSHISRARTSRAGRVPPPTTPCDSNPAEQGHRRRLATTRHGEATAPGAQWQDAHGRALLAPARAHVQRPCPRPGARRLPRLRPAAAPAGHRLRRVGAMPAAATGSSGAAGKTRWSGRSP